MTGGLLPKGKAKKYPLDYSPYAAQAKQIQSPEITIPLQTPVGYGTAFPNEANITLASLGGFTDAGAQSGTFEQTIGTITDTCILRHVTFSSSQFAGTGIVSQGRTRLGIQRAGQAVDIFSINHFLFTDQQQCSVETPQITLKPGDRIYFSFTRNGTNISVQTFGEVVGTKI